MNFDVELVIAGAGGLERLTAALGLDPRRGYNAVAQWRRRGAIPAHAIVEHHKLLKRLEAKGRRATCEQS